MEKILKLYIWSNVLKDYGSGLAVSTGYTKDEAIEKLVDFSENETLFNDLVSEEPLEVIATSNDACAYIEGSA